MRTKFYGRTIDPVGCFYRTKCTMVIHMRAASREGRGGGEEEGAHVSFLCGREGSDR